MTMKLENLRFSDSLGGRVYIDWIGDQPEILVDTTPGEVKKVHFFVTTAGVSNPVFAEAFEDEKLSHFIAELAAGSLAVVNRFVFSKRLRDRRM